MTRREWLRLGFVAYLMRDAFVARFIAATIRDKARGLFQ